MVIACLVVSRLLFDLHALKPMLSGLETIRFNTSLSLLCSGAALFLLNQIHTGLWTRRIGKTLSILVLLMTFLTLGEHFFQWSIGLAICKKIVEIHHGKVWLESEPDKRSVFYFSIPKKKSHDSRGKNIAG